MARKILADAGIELNGDRPWDIQVHNPKTYRRILSGGSLALGESYMDGWWDCESLDEFFTRVLNADLHEKVRDSWRTWWYVAKAKLLNLQSSSRAYEVGKQHYDIGNDLYRRMLDERMVYSCGYWRGADNLEEAQRDKLDLICRKMKLEPGMRVLDIGCGWGSLARFAAEEYGAEVVGVTVSEQQVKLGRERCRDLPVEIRLEDYRELDEPFDRIVSVGMFEHVGRKNYPTYMDVVHRCLNDEGLSLIHTIGGNVSVDTTDPWINKYIFPNGMLPSAKQITTAAEGQFILEDWHNFGPDYDRTLMAWYDNITSHWDELRDHYGKTFRRMWTYYLLSSAGSFRSRTNQLWQIVLSKTGRKEQYRSVR